jgi:hypothetical protein
MHLFSSLQDVQEPLISEFVSQIPTTFVEAYDRLLDNFLDEKQSLAGNEVNASSTNFSGAFEPGSESSFKEYLLSNRRMMLQYVDKFHNEAGTLTRKVYSTIKDLIDPSTKILVSTHQPNLFAYSGIFKKIVLLQTLKDLLLESPDYSYSYSHLKIINLFVVIDHDFADENWIRLAQLPSLRNTDGIMELRLPINKSRRWQMACNMPLPDRTILDHWRSQLYSWLKKSFLFQPGILGATDLSYRMEGCSDDLERVRSTLVSNFEFFWDLVEESYSAANMYSDFNAFLISKIVNKLWQYDTLFIRLTDLCQVLVRGYGNLLRNSDIYSKILSEMEQVFLKKGIRSGVSSTSYLNSPLWLHCKCGSKSATKITNRQIRSSAVELMLEGECMGCKNHLRAELLVDLGVKIRSPNVQVVSDLSPRSIPIVLLLSSELGISCYASGTDGMRYIIFGNGLFKQFSPRNIPVFMVWPARDVYYGFAQREALRSLQLKQRSEIGEYLRNLKKKEEDFRSIIEPVLTERNQRLEQDRSTEDGILSVLFSLKKEQRNVRSQYKMAQKVENALNLRPCIIDYAVNFGLEDIELQWRQNLLYSENLACPAQLQGKFNCLT